MSRATVRVLACSLTLVACEATQPEETTYFDRSIAPVLTTGCARSPTGSGCHVADARGNAFGNLDVSTFAGLDRRRDLLTSYGPYEQPGLLVKAIPPYEIEVRAFDGVRTTVTTDVRHAGGPILDPIGSAYRTLRRWIEGGATANNAGRAPVRNASLPCRGSAPPAGHDLSVDPPTADFGTYRDKVHAMLVTRCADGNCHGSGGNALPLACGQSAEDVRATYWAIGDYVASVAEESELVRRPLAPAQGGTFHEGGPVFSSPSDADYQALVEWARARGAPAVTGLGVGFDFFAHRVQPMLVRKGCMQMQCHSGSSFHDYRLRGGASGTFSLSATRRNYELSLAQLALESEEVTASRLVRKNLFRAEVSPGAVGIVHRGGPLFEDLGAGPARGVDCDGKGYDFDKGSLDQIPAVCIVREWLGRERAARRLAPLTAIVYVSRPVAGAAGSILDFDAYAPGADLRVATVGSSLTVSGDRSLLAGCGLDPATADVKRPAASWDASKIAFAARAAHDRPLVIYEMNADGSGCAPRGDIGAHPPSVNGLLVHDFDPAYSPPLPDGSTTLVFASTRGNLDGRAYDYAGPQRTPADPSRPNANLYADEVDPAAPGKRRVRQLTFLLNTERAPAFMADGRVIFTVEKRMPGFSQTSLRRINLDGGDYHPLYGQRGSVGYYEVSQGVHLADKDFAAIFADHGVPAAGGALGVFSRSIGVDLASRQPGDYPADPSVVDPASPRALDPAFFLHSLRLPDPSSTGRATGTTAGAYTSPAPLSDGRVLVSWGAALAGARGAPDYDVFAIDPGTGARTRVLGAAGTAEIEAIALYARPPRTVYRSQASEPNAYRVDDSVRTADVLMNDADVIFSLMTQNTPTGRVVDKDLRSFQIWEDLPPPVDPRAIEPSAMVKDAFGSVFVRRRLLGEVPVAEDGSAHYVVTGGLPLVIELGATPLSRERSLPRMIPENVMFSPGESVHEGFPRDAFDGFCGGCHGSVSGRPLDAALRPDVLSRASDTVAFRTPPARLDVPPSGRGPALTP